MSTTRKTKIIATLGPASYEDTEISGLIDAGVDLFRINMSHSSDKAFIQSLVKKIRKIAKKKNKPIGILFDLQGPKIRLGKFSQKETMLKTGQLFTLTTANILGNHQKASVSYSHVVTDVSIGAPIYINDGRVQMIAKKKQKNEVVCEVTLGGVISDHKGINLPKTKISGSPITEKDKADALIAIENKADYVAMSFVSKGSDVAEMRHILKKHGGKSIHLIAKIERQYAINNLVDIILSSDAVMVARGDLGVEIGTEHVPKIQKEIIRRANQHIKPVIVATQMLESMITSAQATRAEVSDVANAIYDHCDAVMLSGETAVGQNPIEAVKTMATICLATDQHMEELRKGHYTPHAMFVMTSAATSLCIAADRIADEIQATFIMAFTSSGKTARIASKLNSLTPIIAPTDQKEAYQKMTLYRGIVPMMFPSTFMTGTQWTGIIDLAIKESKSLGYLKPDDLVVLVAGIPFGKSNPNSIRIVTTS